MSGPPVMPEDAGRALREALRCGGQWAELFVEGRDNQSVRIDGGRVAEIRSDRDVGAGVRVIADGRSGFAFTNVLSRRGLLEAAQAATAATMRGSSLERDVDAVDLRKREVATVQRTSRPATDVAPEEVVQLLRRVDAGARAASGYVTNVSTTQVAVSQAVLIASSDGALVTDRRVRTRVTCRVTVQRDGRRETGFVGPGVGAGVELYTTRSPESVGAEAAARALVSLEGVEPPGGVQPVLLGSASGGLLLHEACGHGLEGDGLARETSIFTKTRGTQVGSPGVTAIDDPSLDLGFGSYGADDEGVTTSPTTLIEAGVQVGALTDDASAKLLGTSSSGNGRRESYAHPPLPRMSNTYIASGTESVADMLSSIARGIYVVTLRGGDVDVSTGQFGFSAGEAYLIEHGEVTDPLTGLTLLGNGPAVLASIEGVGDDLALTQALCGKEGQWVPVSYGSPSLLVNGLTITGGP